MVTKKKSGSENRQAHVFIGFRATADDLAEIDAGAERTGLTRSAYVRARSVAAPKTKATRRPSTTTVTLARILGQLGKTGSNLNQIAHHLNAGGEFTRSTRLKIENALTELREVSREIVKAINGGQE